VVSHFKWLEAEIASTNIFIGNLHPSVNENILLDTFGIYGPIANVKIVWPRTKEEFQRGKNRGFISFMNRQDALDAMNNLQGADLSGLEIALDWGKPITLPEKPIFSIIGCFYVG
jgi:U2-associated protein SR140